MTDVQSVPLCDVRAQYSQLENEIQSAVLRVLASGQVILGPEGKALEEEIKNYCSAGYAVGCASGTDALLLALQALDIGPGDEVIVPTFTFFATASTVVRLGAKPVFVDIDPLTFNLNPIDVAAKITPRTRAIIPVHLFGQTAEMEPLWTLADENSLYIIEDAAQAIGAEYQGKRTGTLGAIACFSFYPSKNLGACGDAGMIVTSDPEWANLISALRVHGMMPKYHHKFLGWNSRLDEVQAAILRIKLTRLEAWTEARRRAAQRYDQLLSEFKLRHFFRPPTTAPDRRHVFNQYVVRVADGRRDELVSYLKERHIGCEVYYPIPLHLQECLRFLGYAQGDFPVSEQACDEVLALPMFPELTEKQQRHVIKTCAQFAATRRRMAA